MLETSVWGMLLGLGYVGVWGVIERLLFQAGRRAANATDLSELLHHWRIKNQTHSAVATMQLGWLSPYLEQARSNGFRLLELCQSERLQMLRFSSILPMVADVATAAGLLAAVISLYQTAGVAEHTSIIALGMRATIAGLLIAIPIKIFLGLFADRTDRLVNQADEVIDALQCMLFPPALPSPPEPPATVTEPRRDKPRPPAPRTKRRSEDDTLDCYDMI